MSGRVHVALALVDRDGRWLVARRSERRLFAGYWEFPGGKVEAGESTFAAAVREAREEAGLAVEPIRSLGRIETEHGGQQITLHLVRCRPAGGEPAPSSPAVTEVRWVSQADLRRLRMPPANAEIIDRLSALPGN